jgi:hypothetical protein
MAASNPQPDPRYPVGPFQRPSASAVTSTDLQQWIRQIASFPADLRQASQGLSDAQLDTPYREGGWTVRQLIHHVADSHLHSYARFRFALTEDSPTIKPYPEALWAELPDARSAPIELSLRLLEGLHGRWALLLESMTPEQFHRFFIHPEMADPARLDIITSMYAWHCRHHLAHVLNLRSRMGW